MKLSRRAWTATAVAAAVFGMSAIATAPANATVSCPTGSTAISSGTICQVVLTSGSGSWTVPAGATSVTALVIGGGGGATRWSAVLPSTATIDLKAAGGGGAVVGVPSSALASLVTAGSIPYTVGTGGQSTSVFGNTATSGTASTVGSATAAGGAAGVITGSASPYTVTGGASGNSHVGGTTSNGSSSLGIGGGGAGSAVPSYSPQSNGTGLAPSGAMTATTAPSADLALWTSALDSNVGSGGVFGTGGHYGTGATTLYYGDGAWVAVNLTIAASGNDGAVVFRFAAYDPSTVNSGSGSSGSGSSGSGSSSSSSSSGGSSNSGGGSASAYAASGLASTGADVAIPLTFAGILVLAGIGVITLRRRSTSK